MKECKNCHIFFEHMPYEFTCSSACHDAYVEDVLQNLIKILGTDVKIITDAVSGSKYKVPIRDILIKGVKHGDLAQYPLV